MLLPCHETVQKNCDDTATYVHCYKNRLHADIWILELFMDNYMQGYLDGILIRVGIILKNTVACRQPLQQF